MLVMYIPALHTCVTHSELFPLIVYRILPSQTWLLTVVRWQKHHFELARPSCFSKHLLPFCNNISMRIKKHNINKIMHYPHISSKDNNITKARLKTFNTDI